MRRLLPSVFYLRSRSWSRERISAAAARVQDAHKELAAAGAELLLAIGASETEIGEAANALAEMLDDERAIQTHVDTSAWDSMVADQVIEQREWAAEEAAEALLNPEPPTIGGFPVK